MLTSVNFCNRYFYNRESFFLPYDLSRVNYCDKNGHKRTHHDESKDQTGGRGRKIGKTRPLSTMAGQGIGHIRWLCVPAPKRQTGSIPQTEAEDSRTLGRSEL